MEEHIDNKPKKRRVTTRVFSWVIAAIVALTVLVGIFFILANIFSPDDVSPPDNKDLQLSAVIIPDNENAYFDLKRASEARYDPNNNTIDKTISSYLTEEKEWDENFLKDLFEKNKDAIALFNEAAQKQKFYDPLRDVLTRPLDQDISPPAVNRSFARIISIHARYLAKHGEQKEAVEEAFNIMRVGRMMEVSQTDDVYSLMGFAIKEIGVTTLRGIATQRKLSRDLVDYSISKLNEYRDKKEGMISVMQLTYLLNMRGLESINAGLSGMDEIIDRSNIFIRIFGKMMAKKTQFYYKRNQTRQLSADWARGEIEKAKKSCDTVDFSKRRKLATTGIAKGIFTSNWVGKALVDVVADSFNSFHQRGCAQISSISATQALLAMNAYYANNKVLPNTLDELTKGYISIVPRDSFNNLSLRYSKERNIIYSVGEDRKDDNGDKDKDIVFDSKFAF